MIQPTWYYPRIDGSKQSGSSIKTKGWPPGYQGWVSDMLLIEGMNRDSGLPLEFCLIESFVAPESGQVEIKIYPAIITEHESSHYAGAFDYPCNRAGVKFINRNQKFGIPIWPDQEMCTFASK